MRARKLLLVLSGGYSMIREIGNGGYVYKRHKKARFVGGDPWAIRLLHHNLDFA